MEQNDNSLRYGEAKREIKKSSQEKWKRQHPASNKNDPWHKLSRAEQVTIFRLRTGHTRLKAHLFGKLKIGSTGLCNCKEADETVDHVLNECPLYIQKRTEIWPTPKTTAEKLYGSVQELRGTIAFLGGVGVAV